MCIINSATSCKLATSFWTISVFIHSGKTGNPCESHVIFQDIEHQLQKNILRHYLHYSFL